jgi:hypothetical protein
VNEECGENAGVRATIPCEDRKKGNHEMLHSAATRTALMQQKKQWTDAGNLSVSNRYSLPTLVRSQCFTIVL